MRNMSKKRNNATFFGKWFGYGVIVLVLSSCSALIPTPPPSYASYSHTSPCMDRSGRCFDATIGGQPVVVISDKERSLELTRLAEKSNKKIRSEIYWEVLEPVDAKRALEIKVSPNDFGMQEVGKPRGKLQFSIYPLDGQRLKTTPTIAQSKSVFIGGSPVSVLEHRLAQNSLPAGRYILTIRYTGEHNTDRKSVFLTVTQQ